MGHLHGPVIDGVVNVDQRVKFTREVQSGLFYPWSDVWYADADNGSSDFSGRGASKSKALVSQCITASSAQDIIYVRPRLPVQTDMTDPTAYAENLVIPVDKYGLSIIGAGNNPRNPFYCQIKANATGWGVEIRAVSTLIENLDFNKGSATTGIIHFSGDNGTTMMGWGSLISNCHIRNASSGANAGVTMYGGSYNTIYDTIFEACHTGVRVQSGGTFPIRSLTINKCKFKASNGSAVGGNNIADVGAASIIYELEVHDCRFEMEPTGNFINLTTNTYGLISNCHFGHDTIAVGTEIVIPATVFLAECYDDEDVMIKTA